MRGTRAIASAALLLWAARGPWAIAQVPPTAAPANSAPQTVQAQFEVLPASRPAIRQTTFEAGSETNTGPAEGRVAFQIRAHVNGVAILDQEIRDACYPALVATLNLPEPERSAQQAEIFRRQLEDIIDREVVLQDAFARLSKSGPQYLDKLKAAASKDFDKTIRAVKSRSGCKTDEELKDFLRGHGESLEGMRRQSERNFMFREYLRSRLYPAVERIGRQQIEQYYQEHLGDFQVVDIVNWQDIFIDASRFPSRAAARAFAEQLAARARAGEDFSKLLQYDNGDSSYRNGEGCGQHRGEIRPLEAEPILFRMRDGEVGPVIEIPTGYHVIRLTKRTYAGTLPLDQKTQDDVRKKLQYQVFEREAKRLVADLKQHAAIEIASSTN